MNEEYVKSELNMWLEFYAEKTRGEEPYTEGYYTYKGKFLGVLNVYLMMFYNTDTNEYNAKLDEMMNMIYDN